MRTGNLMPKDFGDSVSDVKGGVRMISSFKAEQQLLHKKVTKRPRNDASFHYLLFYPELKN